MNKQRLYKYNLPPSIPVEDRYQDSGEYVCTAGNGIVGRDGKVKQTGSGYAIINGMFS